jgi:transposase
MRNRPRRSISRGRKTSSATKGYHSNHTLTQLHEWQVRSYLSEPQRGRRHWHGDRGTQQAGYSNRRRIRGEHEKALLRRRGELLERSFAHGYETGGLRRVPLRGRNNVLKWVLIHVDGFNLSLMLLRQLLGKGTPRGLQGLSAESLPIFLRLWSQVLVRSEQERSPAFIFRLSHPAVHGIFISRQQDGQTTLTTGC